MYTIVSVSPRRSPAENGPSLSETIEKPPQQSSLRWVSRTSVRLNRRRRGELSVSAADVRTRSFLHQPYASSECFSNLDGPQIIG
ncbi:hypothetical protein GN956_G19489 [Arapaima gigas]